MKRIIIPAMVAGTLIITLFAGIAWGKQYVIDNLYVEIDDCIHGDANFDYVFYLDGEQVARF